MNKRWRNVGLYVLAVITVIFIGTSVFDKPNSENTTKTLRYSDFIEAVQDKEVSRVLLAFSVFGLSKTEVPIKMTVITART